MAYLDPLLLSRIQFALTVSFHILFPSITIGLAVWLVFLEGLSLAKGDLFYRRLFDFWLKIFAILFVMGVVSGMVMAFQFGTNWSVMSLKTGPVMGPLLVYETVTAFMLEATFLGIVLYGRGRVAPSFYLFSCAMVSLGSVMSSFWILCNNSWMQVPVGYKVVGSAIVPSDWQAIVLGPVFLARWLHMLIGSFLTTTMCLVATAAWYMLRAVHLEAARFIMKWGLIATAALIVTQIVIGDINGKHMYVHQPAKFAAVEARWHSEQPGAQLWFAIPDEKNRRNLFAIKTPYLGSWLATGSLTARVSGLSDFPESDWPPVLIPFFSFRMMVGLGMLMLGISVLGLWFHARGRIESARWFLWAAALAFPSGYLAVIVGWITTEVGRQPWVVYGLLRTADTFTPGLTGAAVLASILLYGAVYSLIFFPGAFYVYRLLYKGPAGDRSVMSEEPLEAGTAEAKG